MRKNIISPLFIKNKPFVKVASGLFLLFMSAFIMLTFSNTKASADIPGMRSNEWTISSATNYWINYKVSESSYYDRAITVGSAPSLVVNFTVYNPAADKAQYYHIDFQTYSCIDGWCSNGSWTRTTMAPGGGREVQVRLQPYGYLAWYVYNDKAGDYSSPSTNATVGSDTYPGGNLHVEQNGGKFWIVRPARMSDYYTELSGGTSAVNKNVGVGDDVAWNGSSFYGGLSFYQSDFHLSDAGIAVSTDNKNWSQSWTASSNQGNYGSTVANIQCKINNYQTNRSGYYNYQPTCQGKPTGRAGDKIYIKVDVRYLTNQGSFAINYVVSTITLTKTALTLENLSINGTFLQRNNPLTIASATFKDKNGNTEVIEAGDNLWIDKSASTFNPTYDVVGTGSKPNTITWNETGQKTLGIKYNWETSNKPITKTIDVNDTKVFISSFTSNDSGSIISDTDCITQGIKLCGKTIDQPVNVADTSKNTVVFTAKYNGYNAGKEFIASALADGKGVDTSKITLNNTKKSENNYELEISIPYSALDLESEKMYVNIAIKNEGSSEMPVSNLLHFNFVALTQPTSVSTEGINDEYILNDKLGENTIDLGVVNPSPVKVEYSNLPEGITGMSIYKCNTHWCSSLYGSFETLGSFNPQITTKQEFEGDVFETTLNVKKNGIKVVKEPTPEPTPDPSPSPDPSGGGSSGGGSNADNNTDNNTTTNTKSVAKAKIKSVKLTGSYLVINLNKKASGTINIKYKGKTVKVKAVNKTQVKVNVKTIKQKFKKQLKLKTKKKTYKFSVSLNGSTKQVSLKLKK
jgi:hypothetical protein